MKKYEIREQFILGSAKSGNWGHAGRPGKRGGSVARSVAMSIRTGKDWKERQARAGSKFGSSKISDSWNAGDGINDAIVLEFEDGTKGIFKKEEGMTYGSADGEILAYELSESLGWDIVPETISYTYGGQEGSLQKWVDDAEVAISYKGSEIKVDSYDGGESTSTNPTMQVQLDRMRVFDMILDNPDRHYGNWLIGKDKIVAIDNGGAFNIMHGGKALATPGGYKPHFPSDTPRAVMAEVQAWSSTPAAATFLGRVSDVMGRAYTQNLMDAVTAGPEKPFMIF